MIVRTRVTTGSPFASLKSGSSYKSIFQKIRSPAKSNAPKSCSPCGSLSSVKSENAITWRTISACSSADLALFEDAILGRRPLPDAPTLHCASGLPTNDKEKEERKFHCGLHKATQGARQLA